jgi:hypothetical protein
MRVNIVAEDFDAYRLDVEVRDEHTIQLVRDSSSGANTEQIWVRQKSLGHGGFGEVWQESWRDSRRDWHYRAVKICSEKKMQRAGVDYKRELSALAAFSESKVKEMMICVRPD